ncbi:MAG TPA: hypothetical protein VF007_02140 [Stellaceae bacterium]
MRSAIAMPADAESWRLVRRLARGHSPDRTDAVVLSGGCIPQPGEPADSARAVAQAGPRAAATSREVSR